MFFSLLFVRQSLSSCATCLYSCNATPISFVCMSVRQSIQQYSTAVRPTLLFLFLSVCLRQSFSTYTKSLYSCSDAPFLCVCVCVCVWWWFVILFATCLYSCRDIPVCMSVHQSLLTCTESLYSWSDTPMLLFFGMYVYNCKANLLLLFCLYVCSPVTYLRVQHAATSAVRSVCPVTQHKAKPPRRAQTLRRAGETTEIRGGYIKWRDKLAENRVKKQ